MHQGEARRWTPVIDWPAPRGEDGTSSTTRARETTTMNDLMSRMDNLVRFANDLEYRMSESGFGGVFAVAEQARRVRQALDRVQPQEIQWARNEVQALIGLLTDVARNLDELNEAKMIFGSTPQPYGVGADGYVTG
jgi:hypothetical protein